MELGGFTKDVLGLACLGALEQEPNRPLIVLARSASFLYVGGGGRSAHEFLGEKGECKTFMRTSLSLRVKTIVLQSAALTKYIRN